MFVYTMSVSPQTALSTSTRRLTVHIVHAMTIHPRNIMDAGSYETLCEVDSSSGDIVIYWIMTDKHTLYRKDSSMMNIRIKQI